MKKSIVIIAAGLVAVASAEERVGVATVSNVAASQDTRTDVLTVTYDLENTQNNESLFVTMDILTNGVSIGKKSSSLFRVTFRPTAPILSPLEPASRSSGRPPRTGPTSSRPTRPSKSAPTMPTGLTAFPAST